jgi:hypothetical protein
VRLRLRRVDPDNPSSTRSLARLAGNLNNKPAARNDHTAQPGAEPTLNRFALKPLALGPVVSASALPLTLLDAVSFALPPPFPFVPVFQIFGFTTGVCGNFTAFGA